MDPSWVLSLPDDVSASAGAEGGLVLLGPHSRLVLREVPPGLLDALRRLAAPGEVGGRLAESVLAAEGAGVLAHWYYHLQHLARRGFLQLTAHAGGERLATLAPAPGLVLTPAGLFSDSPHVLSRFAYLRRSGEAMVLESPLTRARVHLHDGRAAALVHALARPATAAELGERVPGLPAEAVAPLLGLLSAGGLAGRAGAMAEDADPALECWEFHDLLFHARSREGRHGAPVGPTYRLAGQVAPPPAVKPTTTEAGIDLYRPDLEQLQRQDPPFAQVQERRRSLREYAVEPISDRQLGEFLYRVARVREWQEMEVQTPAGPVRMDFAPRPYPAGGALYELEVYVVVNACRGLGPGLYHYDPRGHRLGQLAGPGQEVGQLRDGAALAAGVAPEGLQVLLILTARFPRIAWKYATLAYALTLKHVGVVYQTMYLAATAMGLAPCALGVGDSDLFARAAGTDYYAETSVGEFLLGSRKEKSGPG